MPCGSRYGGGGKRTGWASCTREHRTRSSPSGSTSAGRRSRAGWSTAPAGCTPSCRRPRRRARGPSSSRPSCSTSWHGCGRAATSRPIGVGAAGIVRWPEGRMLWAPNNAYRDWAIRDELERETGLPAVVDNDANVAGFAEARLGEQPYQADAVHHRGHRHRRRPGAGRGDLPRPDGHGRRARPHDRRPARPAVRLRAATAAWRPSRRAARCPGWAARPPPRTRTA